MRRQSHPRAFFDLITGRKVATAAHRRGPAARGSDTLSNVQPLHGWFVGADVPKAGGDSFPWVSESATTCTSHLLRSAKYEIRK
ncbi:hypothetical protein ALC57_06990 [Trachymyrmex cornetzi]|uniref:Uncharacterized protein n=1 Tax=Trachymyrmex cornetzi TaxID=471704 RepID=A0A195E676_9HYME|nr:hypothetical protein ALC57_06990 [Trachymyrmex cornetzi]